MRVSLLRTGKNSLFVAFYSFSPPPWSNWKRDELSQISQYL
jgi:hypothetical protein